jgi:hypothetical protein
MVMWSFQTPLRPEASCTYLDPLARIDPQILLRQNQGGRCSKIMSPLNCNETLSPC